MDTYVMKKELFIDLIYKAKKTSSAFTFADIVNASCEELDIRGVSHRGYFAAIPDFKSYYDANLSLIDFKAAQALFDPDWPIYTRTNDSCPTQYFESADVKSSVVSNGCLIEGMGCPGGCMGGAGTNISLNKAKAELKKYKENSTEKVPSYDVLEIELD